MAEPPECGAGAHLIHCVECGREVEEHESALFTGRRICMDCYRRKDGRCARCFRKLESWQVRFLDGGEYCDFCFLILSERSARRGAGGEHFAFN